MEQSIHRKGLTNWILLLLVGTASVFVARYAHSATGLAASLFLGLGFLVAIVAYFQMRLEHRERLEQLEFDELQRTSTRGAALFEGAPADLRPAQRARTQFERFMVPAITVLLFAIEAGAAYYLWFRVQEDPPAGLQPGTVAMALYGLFALVLFQFGKYSAVLARLERQRLLRPQASLLLLGALLSLITAAVEVAGWAGYPRVDLIVCRILAVVFSLVALETLLAVIFEIYRPRLKGQAEHPLYESRLIGLLSQPGGLITTAAQALDYQFGFKVSETWFYRFLEGALAWLILGQIALLLLSTGFVFVEPGEQALLERGGRPVEGRSVLNPGLHLKWPWPIDRVYRFPTDRIQSFTVGIVHDEHTENERVLLWAKSHAKEEYNMLVASRAQQRTNAFAAEQTVPVNLLAVNVPVQYVIRDLREYAYHHANAGELLERLANGEVTRYLVSVDIDDIMAAGRMRAAEELRQRIQARADTHKLGVRIVFVGLHGIHPPVKVAPEFEKVIGAIQDKEATNLYARAYMATNVPVARGRAAQQIQDAQAYRVRTMAVAEAAAQRFTNQLTAFRASPEVYQIRSYLDTLGRSTNGTRYYVIATTNRHGVITLNLEEKLRRDLLDITLPGARK